MKLIVCQSCGHRFAESQAEEKEVDLEAERGVGGLFPDHHKAKRAVCPVCGSDELEEEYYTEEDVAELINEKGKGK